MFNLRLDNEALLTELALTFPFGSFADFGRRLSHQYEEAFRVISSDTSVREADKSVTIGQLRRAKVNSMLHNFATDCGWNPRDVKMGKGKDNHVEVYAGRLVITCHHLAIGQKLPKTTKYLEQNWELNDALDQKELFQLEDIKSTAPSCKNFNLLIHHTTDPENCAQVGTIDFVFPTESNTIAKFSIIDTIGHQAKLESLPEQDLIILKKRFNRFQGGERA